MDYPNCKNNPSNLNIETSYLTIEEILNSNQSCQNARSTAWRQQSLLIKSFNHTTSNDLMERHCAQHRGLIHDNDTLDKHLQNVQSLLGPVEKSQIKFKFPNIDQMIWPTIQGGNDNIFDNIPKSIQACENSISEPTLSAKQRKGKSEDAGCTSVRSGNTMENFLQRRTTNSNPFFTARQLLTYQNMEKKNTECSEFTAKKITDNNQDIQGRGFNFSASKKSLGSIGRLNNTNRKSFVSPVRSKSTSTKDVEPMQEDNIDPEMASLLSHPALKNIDTKMVELINNEIIPKFKPVDWNDIAGLEYAKSIIKEAVVYPLLRPDIFTGLRRPPRGILLFGPPGTGKTLIGKCIASQSCSTFFSISSSSLTSKWMGEGEKMVRALFAVAVARQPSVIFIDEIDSLLSQRSESENEGTRRLKTEFLVRLDGAATSDDDRVLIVGATNRPQELDEAVRRRFVKRLYVPLPEIEARTEILQNLLNTVDNNLSLNELKEISQLADGYSCADMDSLCREASMEPLRSLPVESIITFNKDNLRPVNINDFHSALNKIRPSVSQKDLNQYVEWNKTYGSSY